METKRINIRDIQLNKGQIEGLPTNPRQWTKTEMENLKKSIEETPELFEARGIIVYPYNGKYIVMGGNMRLSAARALNHKDVPCIVLPEDTPVDKLKEIVVKDNGSFGSWDFDLLANEWGDLPLTDWGVPAWDADDADSGAAEAFGEAKEDDFDESTDQVEKRATKGSIWKLGEHRLMCGDSTSREDVEMLMEGERADMVFTDPPYGMSAVSKSGVLSQRYKRDIMNDDSNEVAILSFKLCKNIFSNARQVWWGANYYTECLPSSECWIVWDKNNGSNDQTDCELAWANFRSVVRQFTMASEKIKRVHPTQKPIKLFAEIVSKFEKKERYNIVVDLFGGSGSTMMACEQLHRKCRMMELDEHYCDVILARWEKMTGKKAERIN